jgi:hypothetical protein
VLELKKTDPLNPDSEYTIWINGWYEGTETADKVQALADGVNIDQMGAEDATRPTRYTKHEQEEVGL